MSDRQRAGYQFDGWHCRRCHDEIQPNDEIDVDCDGEYDDEGVARDLTTVAHAVCPPEDEA